MSAQIAAVLGGAVALLSAIVGLVLGIFLVCASTFGEWDCGKTGEHLGVPHVYDRVQMTCYVAVDGHKIDAKNYRVNAEAK